MAAVGQWVLYPVKTYQLYWLNKMLIFLLKIFLLIKDADFFLF